MMINSECGVYKIVNTITGDFYIGSSVNILDRIEHHKCSLRANRHENKFLQRSWNKYGESVFSFEPILYCDKSTKLYFEQLLLDLLNPTLNLAKDALAPMQGRHHTDKTLELMSKTRRGRKFSDEARRHMSEARRRESAEQKAQGIRRNVSEETRLKLSQSNRGKNNPFYGKRHSDETKRKISDAKKGQMPWNKGKHLSEETKRKISEAACNMSEETKRKIGEAHKGKPGNMLGKHHTEETKRKMSEARKGKIISEETRHKISEAGKGRTVTEETKRKISEANAKRWAEKKATLNSNVRSEQQ